MSKTKMALVLFAVAFGINLVPFLFSKKALVIDEVKDVCLYELPPTSSPLDAYVAVDFGPHNGVIGTLFHLREKFEWKDSTLNIQLKPGLRFSNGNPILPEHWMKTREWAKPYLQEWNSDPLWNAYLTANVEWKSPAEVRFSWTSPPAGFNAEHFMKSVLAHPMTGAVHPENLAVLQAGKPLTPKTLGKNWISSGPYRVRKWNPKEIVLVSRDDFPVILPAPFFRQLKYQSAPVKNPACEFMQAQLGEEKAFEDHRVNPVDQTLHLFWACRSWREQGSFCANAKNRGNFAKLMTGGSEVIAGLFTSQKLRYRIPFGSDAFRNDLTKKIQALVGAAGGTVEEVSYFFKPSTDADLELLFVVTDSRISSENAAKMAAFSSRLGIVGSEIPPHVVGEFSKYPIQVLMKEMTGDAFTKVFLEPDLEEKKIPL